MNEGQRQKCIVHYQVATYSGDEVVYCWDWEESDSIEARAKQQLIRKSGPFPFGCESFKITEREDYFGE